LLFVSVRRQEARGKRQEFFYLNFLLFPVPYSLFPIPDFCHLRGLMMSLMLFAMMIFHRFTNIGGGEGGKN
jgi:hypothetical protein